MSCETPFTEATVPTGMNTGVSTTSCGVVSLPARAVLDVASISKENDTLGIVTTSTDTKAFAQMGRVSESRFLTAKAVRNDKAGDNAGTYFPDWMVAL